MTQQTFKRIGYCTAAQEVFPLQMCIFCEDKMHECCQSNGGFKKDPVCCKCRENGSFCTEIRRLKICAGHHTAGQALHMVAFLWGSKPVRKVSKEKVQELEDHRSHQLVAYATMLLHG